MGIVGDLQGAPLLSEAKGSTKETPASAPGRKIQDRHLKMGNPVFIQLLGGLKAAAKGREEDGKTRIQGHSDAIHIQQTFIGSRTGLGLVGGKGKAAVAVTGSGPPVKIEDKL